jgi:glycosyltransferase involved in cell wall biosynthesis
MDISESKVAIATHYLIYGAPQALRDYLIQKKAGEVRYISVPLFADGNRIYFEKIKKGRPVEKRESRLRTRFVIVNYLIGFFFTLKKCIESGEKIDVFIGVDNLNAFAGIILKKLGIAKKVVFYTIDYVPKRFDNFVLNELYHWLDAFCVRNCDQTWNVSKRIEQARREYHGLCGRRYERQIVVPIGVWPDKVKVRPFEKIRKHRLLFIGHLLQKQGVQYVLDAIPAIVKQIPDFDFLVVGGGEYENELKKQAKRLGIEDCVTFTGWVKERKKIDSLMADSAVAIAMYQKYDEKGNISFTYFADPTKIKDYLSAGLPVIMTDVPHNAREIERKGCGKVIRLDSKDIAAAVVSMMRNEKSLRTYRSNARKCALIFDWNVIFGRALKGIT